jgi:hypothetical protein
VELALIVVLIAGIRLAVKPDWDWLALAFVPLMMWHVVAVPVCVLYLIGRPIVMSLAPLVPSAECRAFREALHTRPRLDDQAFIERFYANGDVPRDIPLRLRNILCGWDRLLGAVEPADYLPDIDDELDIAGALSDMEKEFEIRFADSELKNCDGTFGSLVLLIQEKRIASPQV